METSEFNKLCYIKTNKGGTKLIYKGFAYIEKRELKNSTNWECELRRNKAQCKRQIWTLNDLVIRQSSYQHTHAPDSTLIEVYKINNRIKADAIVQECASTQCILSNNVLTASAECAIKMPTISHIKRRIRHIKQQQRGSGPIPKTDDL